jgi:hypothetical protein
MTSPLDPNLFETPLGKVYGDSKVVFSDIGKIIHNQNGERKKAEGDEAKERDRYQRKLLDQSLADLTTHKARVESPPTVQAEEKTKGFFGLFRRNNQRDQLRREEEAARDRDANMDSYLQQAELHYETAKKAKQTVEERVTAAKKRLDDDIQEGAKWWWFREK